MRLSGLHPSARRLFSAFFRRAGEERSFLRQRLAWLQFIVSTLVSNTSGVEAPSSAAAKSTCRGTARGLTTKREVPVVFSEALPFDAPAPCYHSGGKAVTSVSSGQHCASRTQSRLCGKRPHEARTLRRLDGLPSPTVYSRPRGAVARTPKPASPVAEATLRETSQWENWDFQVVDFSKLHPQVST